ncbi:unnamed protein product [Bartonella choladocola]|uniref:hypothetical protein n=1 Tax=Bartonella choladocola TaxID=2750995 RepID=UPI003998C780
MTYSQLDAHATALLETAIDRLGSIKAVADKIGYKRSSLSLARAGKYPGDTHKLRIAIMENLTGLVACPYLQKELTAADCNQYRNRQIPTSSRAEVKHWQACQICEFNPAKNERKAS